MIYYIVKVEYRYGDYKQEKQTLGTFENIEDAINCGNEFCSILESKYLLNPNYNIKRRFSKSTLTMGNLAYIKTPFTFYATIEKLRYFETEQLLNKLEKEIDDYRKDKEKLSDLLGAVKKQFPNNNSCINDVSNDMFISIDK